ncbi:MAG TPA: sialidase family protein [Pyrinomonadaceae bacterium]|nr:sialidase family protein [Pyrinomonadaceae bacterium]
MRTTPTKTPSLKHVFVYLLVIAINAITLPSLISAQTIKDIATNATDPSNLSDTEPSIAVDPTNPNRIAIVTFAENWGPGQNAPVWISTDGGTTWTKSFIIGTPASGQGGSNDQKIVFDSMGRLLAVQLDFGLTDFIYRQTGALGTNLTSGTGYGNDQPHIDVDRTPASPCFNRVYSPWLNTNIATWRSNVERSTDFGATVTAVPAGSTAFHNRTTRVAVAPNGRAYIIYKTREGAVDANFENAHFRVERSDDCGVTWNALGATGVAVHAGTAITWFSNAWGNSAKGKTARARSSDAWIAVDPNSGDVYAAYCHRDASGFGQIFVSRSTDMGATWSSTRITDGTHHSAYPEIAVAGNGAIGLLYIDYDDSGASTIFRHRLARSFNLGSTWTHSNLQSMDPGPIANAASGFLWGDYEGITAHGNKFYGVFTGQSIGRATLQLDPIFFTAPATNLFIPNICKTKPWICKGVCDIPCNLQHCISCMVEIFIDRIEDPWEIVLFDPAGKRVNVQQTRRRNTVTMRFRPSRQFADRLEDYTVVFQGGKEGARPDATIRARQIR